MTFGRKLSVIAGMLALASGAAGAADPGESGLVITPQVEIGAIIVPRPSFHQVYSANTAGGVVGGNLAPPVTVGRDYWAPRYRAGVDFTVDSPTSVLGDRWTVSLRGGVHDTSFTRSALNVNPGVGFLALITQPIVGGTASTAAGAGAQVFGNDVRTDYSESIFYYDVDGRLTAEVGFGDVILRPSIGAMYWDWTQDAEITNASVGAATSNFLKLDTDFWNVGPAAGLGFDWQTPVHFLSINFDGLAVPYYVDAEIDAFQSFTGGAQDGRTLALKPTETDWGLRARLALGFSFLVAPRATFGVGATVDYFSHVPIADVPDSNAAPALNIDMKQILAPSATARFRYRF